MGRILDVIIQHLEEHDFKYQLVPDTARIQMNFGGRNGRWTTHIRAYEERGRATVYSSLPIFCPEEKRGILADLLCRANYGLWLGNFEMDMRDGEIRYKTSMGVGEKDDVSDAMVRVLLTANFSTVDRYYPGIMKLIYGDMSAKEAVEQCEDTPSPKRGNSNPGDISDHDADESTSLTDTAEVSGESQAPVLAKKESGLERLEEIRSEFEKRLAQKGIQPTAGESNDGDDNAPQ